MKEKDFVPYEESQQLSELGFNECCFAAYCSPDFKYVWQLKGRYKHNYFSLNNDKYCSPDNKFVTAPLYQQAFEWFRVKHNLTHSIDIDDNGKYFIATGSGYGGNYKTYEEAELTCLRELIEIITDKELVTLYKIAKEKMNKK